MISCLFRTKLYCSPVEIIPDENVQAFEKIGCRTPERLLEMKAVVDKPHEPVALPLLSKSLASSLAAHYGVESGNRRVPAVTQTFVENELLAEAAEGFEIVLQTHFKARIGERGKNCDFAVEHFTVAGTRHWRETTQFEPPFGHATLGLTAAGLMFMNPLVRGIIIKQGFTMFSLFLMGLPTSMPVWLAETMATCNEYVPGSVPVIIMWVATVGTVVVAILLFKVKKLVDVVIHYRTEARLRREAEMQDRAKLYARGYLDTAFKDAPRGAVDAARELEPDPAEVKIVFGDDDEPAVEPPADDRPDALRKADAAGRPDALREGTAPQRNFEVSVVRHKL